MELSSSETNSYGHIHKLLCILENRRVNYRVHYCPPLVFILSQINEGHSLPFCSFYIYFNINPYLFLCFQSNLSPFVSPLKPFMYIHYSTCTTCPAHHILLLLTTRMIFREYRSRSFWNAPQRLFMLYVRDRVSHPHFYNINCNSVHFNLSKFLYSKRECKRL
jgi:hypothetical protein